MQIMPDEEMNMCLQMLEVLSEHSCKVLRKSPIRGRKPMIELFSRKAQNAMALKQFSLILHCELLREQEYVLLPVCNTLEKALILINLLRNNSVLFYESSWKLMGVCLE